MLVGASQKGLGNLKLNAGVLIENFEVEGTETLEEIKAKLTTAILSEQCLGTTRGGNTFVSEPETRTIEYDGRRTRIKGDFVKDNVNVKIETNLMEYTTANLKRILGSVDIQENTKEGKIISNRIRERIQVNVNTDYIDSLSLAADLNDGGGVIIFTIFNCINTSGINAAGEDKDESVLPVTFEASSSSFQDNPYAPYEIWIFPYNHDIPAGEVQKYL